MNAFGCDVLVVGGGVAGMAAALTAARRGVKTLLLEKRAQLGGILRAGLGFPVCGLFDSNGALLNSGLLHELTSAIPVAPEQMGRVWIWPCPTERILECFERWLSDESDLTVMKNTAVTAVGESDGNITCVEAGGFPIHPKVVVDCSGDGVVVQCSSAGQLDADGETLGGYSIRLRGLEEDPLLPIRVPHALRNAPGPGYLRFTSFCRPDCLKLAVPPAIEEMVLRRDLDTVLRVLREKFPAFGNAVVAETSPYVMLRDGVRLHGRYILEKADVLSGRRFEDAVAKCAWPIERWDPVAGQQLEYLSDGAYYEIPERCMQSPDIGNLLAAGRCISATLDALASTRVMGACLATGEAAGTVAARLCS